MKTLQKICVGGVPEHFNLPWHNALADDAFKEIGLDVEFKKCPGGTGEMTSLMKSGDLDAALLLFEGAVTNILRDNPNRIVKVYVQSPLIWGIDVSANSSINAVEEIQDKVYAISRAGSGSHLIAIVDAAERDWPIDDIKFSKVGNLTGAREKLANGKVDVFLWEKFTTQPLVDSGEFRRVGERVVPWPAFVVAARQDVIASHGAKLRQMLEIVDRYSNDFKNNANATEIVTEKFGIKKSDSEQWFAHVQWHPGFQCPDETISTIVRYLSEVKIIDTPNATAQDVWQNL